MNEIENLPHNAEAEEAVIACCLLDDSPANYNSVTELVSADDF